MKNEILNEDKCTWAFEWQGIGGVKARKIKIATNKLIPINSGLATPSAQKLLNRIDSDSCTQSLPFMPLPFMSNAHALISEHVLFQPYTIFSHPSFTLTLPFHFMSYKYPFHFSKNFHWKPKCFNPLHMTGHPC